MRVFCDAPPLKPRPDRGLRALLWRKSERIDEQALAEARKLRGAPSQQAVQPAPYWAIESESLLIVGVDTGIKGHRRRADRVAAPYLARPPAEDPHHRQADLHARRPQALGPGGRGHHRRHRPRPRAPLRRGDRR
ncbi:hypothetical protein ACFQGX_30685 [Nonomuraea dietziae]|uniref:hypothetical protein n=1 Tax=Nonomuraea dietziae TaxID=65515 RepID=UPI003614487B